MPFYWGDYLKKTARFTLAHHGAYLLLIAEYWTTGKPLPADPAEQALIVRTPTKKWLQLRPKIAEKFDEHGGLWRHERIEKELVKARANHEAKAKAGAEGAAKRWRMGVKSMAQPLAEPSGEHCLNDASSPSPTSDRKSIPRSGAVDIEDFGRIFDEQLWPIYPSRGESQNPKKPARQKFLALCKRGEDPSAIVAGVKAYAANPTTKVGTQFVKTAETYLSKECWKEEKSVPESKPGAPTGWSDEDARWLSRLICGQWSEQAWGPLDPTAAGFRIPLHVYRYWETTAASPAKVVALTGTKEEVAEISKCQPQTV